MRNGTRECVLDVARRHPDRLKVELEALATRVLFDDEQPRRRRRVPQGPAPLPRHPSPSDAAGEPRRRARSREVILAGGAFNTPQLLMLSGIGPRAELEAHGIPRRVDLPGVGRNLQDRYEVGVVNRLDRRDWEVLNGATLRPRRRRPPPMGASASAASTPPTASPVASSRRSHQARPTPDLFLFALLARFAGYYPRLFPADRRAPQLPHLVHPEGAHLQPRRHGQAALGRSARPAAHQLPLFRGRRRHGRRGPRRRRGGHQVRAPHDGAACGRKGMIAEEELPGRGASPTRSSPSSSATMPGATTPRAAARSARARTAASLDARFRGPRHEGLRVVDASVFPRIPGFFIVSAVYMIGEKAADVISRDALTQPQAAAR